MTHNETVNFLILQGWDWDPNLPDGACFRDPNFDSDWQGKEWYTIEEALSIEKDSDPESYSEYQMIHSLDTRYLTMVSQYMDS